MKDKFKSLTGTLFGGSNKGHTGVEIREQDDLYQDSPTIRRRGTRWVEDQWFSKSPLYIFLISFLLSYLIVGFVLFLLITSLGSLMFTITRSYGLYQMLKIKFIWKPWFSVFLWAYTHLVTFILALLLSLVVFYKARHHVRKFKATKDAASINTYENDSYVLTVPEMVKKYIAVPDAGAHFKGVDVTSIIAHIPISNKGIDPKEAPVLYENEKGKMVPKYEIEEYTDKKGRKRKRKKIITKKQPLIDEEGAIQQLINVGVHDEKYHTLHDASKLVMFERDNITLAEFINERWYIPEYETQRPTGVYLVDTSPINVMVVAMTRGNKGQCIINPYIDLLTRQDEKVNLFVNDPKGELYTAFFASLHMRGFDTVVFNLLDPLFTDQYNPLSPAIMYARKGYETEPQDVLTILADNFFPMPPGGSDPFWTKAERILFNMLTLVLLDLYYEEEQEFLANEGDKLDPIIIQNKLDDLWGYVTISNVYHMVSVLATRKAIEKDQDGNDLKNDNGEVIVSESSLLDKLFEYTSMLPLNPIRRLFASHYSNFSQMADNEKMRASIYGLTLTEMAFFIEGPVVALTSASPKKSFDLVSMSFPRRLQFKFNEQFVAERGFVATMVYFEFYKDPYFKEKYEGDDFSHATRIDMKSWVEFRFAGILPNPVSYIKITVKPRDARGITYGTYYAEFTKGFLRSSDNRTFARDPITNEYQIKDGVIHMGQLDEEGKFTRTPPKAKLLSGEEVSIFDLTEVAYLEKPLAVFSVTPPSKLVYVKIVLMIIHSVFNTTVENSYLTKESGKPILKTKYIFDELGNLQYEGAGVKDYPTKLSIGLAQGQEYLSVFQTMQQITDVYGDTADRIIASNTGVTIFLLSSDLDMLETFSKQGGIHHVERLSDSHSLTVGAFMNKVEDTVSVSRSLEEEPLFTVNRLLRMTNGEALVLSTTKRTNNDGSNTRQQPIFCTKETSLPMAWSLHKHGYEQRKFSMLTVPTANSTARNKPKIPPFEALFYKREQQAYLANEAVKQYRKEKKLPSDIDYELELSLNPTFVSKEVMRIINQLNREGASSDQTERSFESDTVANREVEMAHQEEQKRVLKREQKIYDGNRYNSQDLSLGVFKTLLDSILKDTSRHIILNNNTSDFEIVFDDEDNSIFVGRILYHNETFISIVERVYEEGDQLSDGTAKEKTSFEVTISQKFIEYLQDHPYESFCDITPFNDNFWDKVYREFEEQSK